MSFKQRQLYKCFVLLSLALAIIGVYFVTSYDLLRESVKAVVIVVNKDIKPQAIPLLYVAKGGEESVNFKTVHNFKKLKDSTYITEFSAENKLRRLRLYLDYPDQRLKLFQIKILTEHQDIFVDLDKIDEIQNLSFKHDTDHVSIVVKSENGYIELPKRFAYTSDFDQYPLLILALLILISFAFLTFEALPDLDWQFNSMAKVALGILIISIFCPAPIYNIALIILVVVAIKKLRFLRLNHNQLSLIILAFFLVYLINNLFISLDSYHDLSIIERFIPFVILSLMIPSVADRKLLMLFPIVALFLGFYFASTSLLDAFIYKNPTFLSFDLFTKYLHPVYYSYLLFFSICYVKLVVSGLSKYYLITVMLLLLIFSGSKMVLVMTLLVLVIDFLRHKKTILLIIPILAFLILFSPLKKRFADILSLEDTSILNEEYIADPYDGRINGLTLRLMLCREALATMSGIDFLLGTGVTDEAEDRLSTRLMKLGLVKHQNFNPHNQYIDTFWKTGIIGFILLVMIPCYSLVAGLKRKDKLLIYFSVFFMAVMFTESVFGRVNGVYFFTLVLLILINSKPKDENSYIKH